MGLFVCIEGIDGSGKSTVANQVCEILNQSQANSACLLDRKNTEYDSEYLSSLMTDFKNVLWKEGIGKPVREVTDHGWLFFHAAWYTIVAANTLPRRLETYEYVLMDGWIYKIMSRFMAKGDFDTDLVSRIFEHLPRGDKIFFLEASPAICYERKTSFTDAEIGENEGISGEVKDRFISYQAKVLECYKALSVQNNWQTVDASEKNAEDVSKIIAHQLLSGAVHNV
ncbi:MAG: hypothetical protein FWD93_05740 [Coriobacteriia bacterium]|nr:hypothetical protein [Coriobacteriia bacterium]